MILVAGALLAAALGASLLAGRLRVPGLVLFLGHRHGGRLRRPRLDRLQRLRARAQTIGIVALGADPVRGRPGGRLRRDPPGAAAGARRSRSSARSLTAVDHRPRRRRGCSTSTHARGPAARLDRRRDRRRGDLRGAARLDAAAPARAHARGRGRHQRPGRGPARASASSTGSSSRDYGLADMLVLFVAASSAIGARRSGSRSAGSRSRRCRACGSPSAGLYPVASLATAALAFGAADALHGSGFLAVYLAGLALGSGRHPGAAHDRRRSTTGWPGSRSSAMFLIARPARLPVASSATSRSRAPSLALVVVARRAPARACRRARRSRASRCAERARARLGRPARRGARRARDVPGDRRRRRQRRTFFNIVFFAVAALDAPAGRDVRAARATGSASRRRGGDAARR